MIVDRYSPCTFHYKHISRILIRYVKILEEFLVLRINFGTINFFFFYAYPKGQNYIFFKKKEKK